MSVFSKEELRPEAQAIIALAQEVRQGTDEIRLRTRRTIEAATKLGRMLLIEQKHVHQLHGPNEWENYFEKTFSEHMSIRSAYLWMRLARTPRIAQDSTDCNNGAIAASPIQPTPKQERYGMAALGLLPVKEQISSEVGPRDAKLPMPTSHLSFVNRFAAWQSSWPEHGEAITPEFREILLRDCAKMIAFFNQLQSVAI